MPGYVKKALLQFKHKMNKRKQNQPLPATEIDYGAKKQYATKESTAPPLDVKGKRFI